MTLTIKSSDFNDFARGLSERIGRRLIGSDASAERIVDSRPQDHVLAGFLTPTGGQVNGLEDGDDLPRDSAYEQTAMGFEWLLPHAAVASQDAIEVEISFFTYVRRLPAFAELESLLVWRVPRNENSAPTEVAMIPMVWTREGPFNLHETVNLELLLDQGRLTVPLESRLRDQTATISTTSRYPTRQQLRVTREDVRSHESYQRWVDAHAPRDVSAAAWLPELDARLTPVPSEPNVRRLALRVVNRTPRPTTSTQPDFVDSNLYGLHVRATIPLHCHQRSTFNELPASFRYERSVWAIGINAQPVHAANDLKLSLETRPIALTETARLVPRDVPGATPTFRALSQDPVPLLRLILADMTRYASDDWTARIATLHGLEREEAHRARETFELEVARFREGVELLADERYPDVRRAFSLMNEAMALASPGYYEWRLFQIIFIVSQLRELAAREHTELRAPDDGLVDILWFAAGGGKTEGFLGLLLWQAFFDRLRGKSIGISGIVRFPLRLLGFQQFQRIGRALAKAEILRMREKLGGERFSLGFFVGSQVTPNTIDAGLHEQLRRGDIDKKFQRVLACPFCESNVELKYNAALRLLEHHCVAAACPGGPGRLPVYIIDADVYRFLPTVLVSTVDKFALLGQNQRFPNLLGRIDTYCPIHGASFRKANKECGAAQAAQAMGCDGGALQVGPFHDPSPALLVQDEMHLLSEELGAFDAHYETATVALAETLGGRPWKVIGATATIEDFKQHAWQLYLRHSRRFPVPGPEAERSFYYEPASDRLGRIFLGVQGVGRKHTPIVTRTLTLIYLELEQARTLASSPDAFAQAYGVRRLPSDQLLQLVFRYEVPLTYVLTRKGSDQVSEAIESRVRKDLEQAAAPHYLDVRTFNSGVDMVQMIATMNAIQTATADSDPGNRIRGVVATNIIGHGVDVDRFNVMVFAGFTRLVAEYIQASARVGRTFPGLSVLVITPQSERDRSVFERFEGFHRYLDRLVDPSAVNRWSEPALARTLPGVLCGYIFGVAARELGRSLATVEQVKEAAISDPPCLREDNVVAWMLSAYGTEHAPSPGYAALVARHTKNKLSLVLNAPPAPGPYGRGRTLGQYLDAMKSLRDVDESAQIRVRIPDQVRALERLIHG